MSSLVTRVGKLVAVSATRAAGEAIHDFPAEIELAVVVVTKPVVRVVVPKAKVALAPRGVLILWG